MFRLIISNFSQFEKGKTPIYLFIFLYKCGIICIKYKKGKDEL